MNIDPVPLEKLLRAETVARALHDLPREELEAYTAKLLTLIVKLTHYTSTMRDMLIEIELGSEPGGKTK